MLYVPWCFVQRTASTVNMRLIQLNQSMYWVSKEIVILSTYPILRDSLVTLFGRKGFRKNDFFVTLSLSLSLSSPSSNMSESHAGGFKCHLSFLPVQASNSVSRLYRGRPIRWADRLHGPAGILVGRPDWSSAGRLGASAIICAGISIMSLFSGKKK